MINSFLDMLSVVIHDEEIQGLGDVSIHPTSRIVGGSTHKLIDFTIEVLAWIQDVMFDDRKKYDTSSEDQAKPNS